MQAPFPTSGLTAQGVSEGTELAGKWTYRSFHNNPALIDGDPNKALRLIFAEAVFNFEAPSGHSIKGTIDWEGGGLDLQGTVQSGSEVGTVIVDLVGTGRPGTPTAGWEYD